MLKKTLFLVLLFIMVRGYTIYAYKDFYYLYGDFSQQFSIASAMYNGHSFSLDMEKALAVNNDALKKLKYIPLENWKNYSDSGRYTTFPGQDLPGYGYLIAVTSKLFGNELTANYAFAIQILVELLSLLGFLYCVYLPWGEKITFIAGLIYIFAYPFIWPIVTQPARDVFAMGNFSAVLVSFFIFKFKTNWCWWFTIISLLTLAAVLLWIRPSSYYYFFFISPLIFFVKNRSVTERLVFFLSIIVIPIIVFGIPFKSFNLKYYGVVDSHVVGRGMWEGLGIVKDNPYGFVLNDLALVPFIEKHYHRRVEHASVAMNQLASDYVFEVIKKDPLFYLKAVNLRLQNIFLNPVYWFKSDEYWNVTPVFTLLIKYAHLDNALHYNQLFFSIGLILTLILFFIVGYEKLFVLALISPLLYTLGYELLIHHDPKTTVIVAWVLILPMAYFINALSVLLARYFRLSNWKLDSR